MSHIVLHHADILTDGRSVDLARAALAVRRPRHLHGHDFYELLWIQNGTLRHLTQDGAGITARRDIGEGALLFVRPGDVHGLQGRGADTLVVSLTLHPGLVADLNGRHPRLTGQLFAHGGAVPLMVLRDARQMADLNRAANLLELSPRDTLAAEAFLLPLMSDLLGAQATPNTAQDGQTAPDWLRAACAAAREPAVFRLGAAGLVRLAGRAHPHVSRSMRRFYGQSPSEFINARRMDFAARRLAGSGDSLSEIAADCGIPNLSHFHKLFRAAHGTTPRHYRHAHRQDVLHP